MIVVDVKAFIVEITSQYKAKNVLLVYVRLLKTHVLNRVLSPKWNTDLIIYSSKYSQ